MKIKNDVQFAERESDRIEMVEWAVHLASVLCNRKSARTSEYGTEVELSQEEQAAYDAALGFLRSEFQKGPTESKVIVTRDFQERDFGDNRQASDDCVAIAMQQAAALNPSTGDALGTFSASDFAECMERLTGHDFSKDEAKAVSVLAGRLDVKAIAEGLYQYLGW